MGGKGGKKRKGGLVVPSFGAGGLRTPSPTPSVGGWETEDEGRGGGSVWDVSPKVPRVGSAKSVAGVDAVAEEMDKLRLGLRTGSARDQLEGFIYESGLSVAQRRLMWRLINEMVGEEIEAGVMGEKERLRKVEDAVLDSCGEVGTVVTRLVAAEAERDEARKGEAHWKMRLDRHMEGRAIVEKEMKRLLVEGFDLRDEIDRLKKGKVARGKDKGVGPTLFGFAPVDRFSEGVQTVGAEVSTVGVQTDVSRVQVVRETTYASVASQACPEVAPSGVGVDVGMGGMGGGPSGPPLVPLVPGGAAVPVPGVVRAQALLIHGVDCRRSMGTLFAAARRLRVGECTVRGVRWLLGVGRRWGKRMSSVVVYLDRPVEVRGGSVWFGGSLHPVERYVFGR